MTTRADLAIDPRLARFIETEVLPGSDLSADAFWAGLSGLVAEFGPRIAAALARRDHLQAQIDDWYRANADRAFDIAAETAFLTGIGYLAPEPAAFTVATENVDPEFSQIAGPQLVVPITNARYALNAANARWGSLYDALYGTDAISEADGATRAGAEELPAGGGGAGGDAGGGRRDSEEMLGRQAALWELLGGRRGDSAWPSYP